MLPLRIVLADDHAIFRHGLRHLLQSENRVALVAEASDGADLLQAVAAHNPDAVITDVHMPGMNGIEACKALSQHFPHLPVIALSTFNHESSLLDMLEAGARGYLLKTTTSDELVEAVQAVCRGETFYCADTVQQMAGLLAQSRSNRQRLPLHFTGRELEVMTLICREQSTKEIAMALGVTARTVEDYREKLSAKTGARNTAGIVVYAIRHKLFFI